MIGLMKMNIKIVRVTLLIRKGQQGAGPVFLVVVLLSTLVVMHTVLVATLLIRIPIQII